MAGIWDGRHQQLAYVSEPDLTLPNQSASEVLMEEAWRTFYHSVSISSRYNPEWRRRLMPKRFWATSATGARQLVVHEALESTWCRAGS